MVGIKEIKRLLKSVCTQVTAPPGFRERLLNRLMCESKMKGRAKEELPPLVYAIAWSELYKLYGERLDQDGLNLMDAVLGGVITEIQDEQQREKNASNR